MYNYAYASFLLKSFLYTAVSRKDVLQTGKRLRDNVESYYG